MADVSVVPRLRRSVLFVPAGDPRKIDRARGLGADTLVLDLEDAIPPGQKAEARASAIEALEAGDFGTSELALRINPPGTPFHEEDLEAAAAGGVDAVMLPKAESAPRIATVAAALPGDVALLLLIETPLGVADALSLARASVRIEALCFGHADFALQMGLADTRTDNEAVLHARAGIAIAAKAREVSPIDCVYLGVKDEPGFRADTARSLAMGYEGRLCIHPRQVEIANEIFTPSADQIDYAERVVRGWQQAARAGAGVAVVDGKMIDAPLVAQQRRVLARAGAPAVRATGRT